MLYMKKGVIVLLAPLLLSTGVAGCSKEKPVVPATSPATIVDATISPEKAVFNANVKTSDYRDVVVALNSGSHTLKQITWATGSDDEKEQPAAKALFEGADYKKDGDKITFLKESLKENMPREGGNVSITFQMSGGANPELTLSLAPDESGFDLEWYLNSLRPEGATQTGDADNKIFLSSSKNIEQLIAFYQKVITKSGMKKTEPDPTIKADWAYAGIRGDFKFGIYLTKSKKASRIELTFYPVNPE